MPATFAQLCRLPITALLCSFATAVGAMDAATSQVEGTLRPDLKVVEVRLIDAGDATQNLGPSYRVTVQNNSTESAEGFEVALLAGIDFGCLEEISEAEGRIEQLGGGMTRSVDLRLPAEALRLRRDEAGSEISYRLLLVVVDPGNEIEESNVRNNRTAYDRDEIRSVEMQLISSNRPLTASAKSP